MVTFLGVNGYTFDASDAEVVTTFVTLAAGNVSESQLADWIRDHARQSRS
jgi:death-on-curing protein